MILSVQNLQLSFGNHQVLNNLSFELAEGEIACLLGSSGCGKTTVLRAIAGFEKPDNGQIELDGKILSNSTTFIEPHQRHIGMVFQDYALFPHLTVAQNIAFGLARSPRSTQQQRTAELLDLIGLTSCAKRYPHELSGGQQQRIALARALAPRPKLILLDEPFSNLDTDLRSRLSKEVRHLLKQQNISAIMVTHDQHEAFAIADKMGIMVSGRLKQWNTPSQLYHNPTHSEIATFFGQGVLLKGKASSDQITLNAAGTLTGILPSNCQFNDVEVLIRPHEVYLDSSSPHTATITDRDFQGSHTIYTLTLHNGETLFTRQESTVELSIGNAVNISLKPAQLIAFPYQPAHSTQS